MKLIKVKGTSTLLRNLAIEILNIFTPRQNAKIRHHYILSGNHKTAFDSIIFVILLAWN